ncbi:uncharacterized protein LOC132204595 [Neocloeon triangulifer]|uniref:uncharacterized protein LOC132204595 n=1 Tax=Neocloeon triangulifer TaxID=2078957 RepID=UPI00286F88D0|nr:uncharacterized protein LOC132204595 [Neocloeon triangulifer]
MELSPRRSQCKKPRKSEVALSEVTAALKNAAINNNNNSPPPSRAVRSISMPALGEQNKVFSEICIDFPDVLSNVTCSELIIELIKYILFMKEQIPYQYNQLKYVVDRKKKWDIEKGKGGPAAKVARPSAILAEKHYRKACCAIESLEKTFESIRQDVQTADSFAIVIGATVATPQELYIVELPAMVQVPQGSPPSRICLTRLLREMIASEGMQKLIGKPFHPTNTFLLLHKTGSSENSCFDPKPNFTLPKRTQRVVMKFNQPPSIEDPNNFKVFSDMGVESMECDVEKGKGIWYQAKSLVAGFKDCWIGDECATEVWLKV